MDIILYARKTNYMKRFETIQNIIAIFTINTVLPFSSGPSNIENSSPITTMSSIPYIIDCKIELILSYLQKVLQTTSPK